MGIKKENEITVKIKCEINELCTILENKGFNKEINTIEKLKKQIIDIQIPIDTTNFFVKKAEIELDKLMDR